jgi:FixJ family two-component response regulator
MGAELIAPDPRVDGTICVIDGDLGIRNSLSMLLGTLGLQATTFRSAEEFLNQLGSERPSFLIVELSLPGMDGFELKKTLNNQGVRVPVMGLTCEADQAMRIRAHRLGFLELVEKPFVYWSVVERVRESMGVPG